MGSPDEPRLPFEHADDIAADRAQTGGDTPEATSADDGGAPSTGVRRWVPPALASPSVEVEPPPQVAAKQFVATGAVLMAPPPPEYATAATGSRLSAAVRAAAWVALALIVGAVAATFAHRAWVDGRVPREAELSAAAAWIGAEVGGDDAIAFVPSWSADRQWLFARQWQAKGLEFERAHVLGEPIDPWDCDGFRRLWVVSTHGRTALAEVAGARELKRRDFGHGTAAFLYALPASSTVFDFRHALARAEVAQYTPGAPPEGWHRCSWRDMSGSSYEGGMFDCGAQDWRNVWSALHEVGGSRRRAMWIHPPFDGGAVRVTWRDLPPAHKIAGRVGNRLWAVRHGTEGSAVRLRIFAGERRLYEKVLAPDDFGWYPFEVALKPDDVGQPISFEVWAARIDWREPVVDARLVGAGAPR